MYQIKMSDTFWRSLNESGIITDLPPSALHAYRSAQQKPLGSGTQRIITGTHSDLYSILNTLKDLVDDINARKRRACDFTDGGTAAIRRYAQQWPTLIKNAP